jgi:hypothetical protein
MKVRINKTGLFSRLVLAVVAAILLNACGKDSRLIQEEVTITEKIKGIIVEGPWEMEVIMQDSVNNSALLEYNESVKNRVSAELLPSGYLHLKIASGGNMRKKVFRAIVNASWLEKIELSGAADIHISEWYETTYLDVIDISLIGSSKLNWGGLVPSGRKVGVVNIAVSGASTFGGTTIKGSIVNAKISGASYASFSYYGYSMEAEVSGASELSLWGSQIINYCAVDCSGASKFEYKVNGYAGTCSFKGSGSSHFETQDFEADYLDVELSGASEAKVKVNKTIIGSLTGASTLQYKNAKDVSGVSVDNTSKIVRVN